MLAPGLRLGPAVPADPATPFGYWLRDEGTSLKVIGFISWVGLAYSLKLLWAPLVDRRRRAAAGPRLGRRRGWMLLSQIVVAAGLIGMAAVGPGGGLTAIGAFAVVVAFASATQDIVIDAWRIEAADDGDELGLLSSAYQLGYRIALLVADAAIIAGAAHLRLARVLRRHGRADGDRRRRHAVRLRARPRRRGDARKGAAVDAARLLRRGRRAVHRLLRHPQAAWACSCWRPSPRTACPTS